MSMPPKQEDELPPIASSRGPVFERTRNLSYERRKAALLHGETAIVVDPIESPLWYVNHYNPAAVEALDTEQLKRMSRLAGLVMRWRSRATDTAPRVKP